MQRKPAVFVDRDGVINKKMPEGDYVKTVDEFQMLPAVPDSFKRLKDKGYLIIVVTNQRCIARGIIDIRRLDEIHEKMRAELGKNGAGVDAIYYCPHDVTDNCDCRKPKPGLILKAIGDYKQQGIQINIDKSFLIGDSESDILAGKAAGLTTVKIGAASENADIVEPGLVEFIRHHIDVK